MNQINDRHIRFVERYCTHFNGARAAREAGYSENRDAQTAHDLLNDPDISRLVQERLEEVSETAEIPISKDLFDRLVKKFGSPTEAIDGLEDFALQILESDDLTAYMANKKRGHIDDEARYAILRRAGFKCQACGAQPSPENDVDLQVDHIVPHSWGGSAKLNNLQALCGSCNSSKSDRFAYDHNKDQKVDLAPESNRA